MQQIDHCRWRGIMDRLTDSAGNILRNMDVMPQSVIEDSLLFPAPVPPERLSRHTEHMRTILTSYALKGMPLSRVASPAVLNRKIKTLKGYCRRFDISFPDYTPRNKKPKGLDKV